MSNVITGYAAIEYAETHPEAVLCKYADPTEGAMDDITIDYAREIAREDPSLIYTVIGA